MQNKHKGITLIEVITVVGVFAVIMVPFAHLSRSMVADIPGSYRLYQLNESLLHAIRTLRDDITKADDFILENGTDGKDWILSLKGAPVDTIYTFGNGSLSRIENNNKKTWKFTRVKIELNPFSPEPDLRAVEVHTYLSFKKYGREQKKLENNYLFYTSHLKAPRGGTP